MLSDTKVIANFCTLPHRSIFECTIHRRSRIQKLHQYDVQRGYSLSTQFFITHTHALHAVRVQWFSFICRSSFLAVCKTSIWLDGTIYDSNETTTGTSAHTKKAGTTVSMYIERTYLLRRHTYTQSHDGVQHSLQTCSGTPKGETRASPVQICIFYSANIVLLRVVRMSSANEDAKASRIGGFEGGEVWHSAHLPKTKRFRLFSPSFEWKAWQLLGRSGARRVFNTHKKAFSYWNCQHVKWIFASSPLSLWRMLV